MAGAKLVMPGPRLDGEGLHELLQAERVTITAGVPTIWSALLGSLAKHAKTLDHLDCLTVGRPAAPPLSIGAFG